MNQDDLRTPRTSVVGVCQEAKLVDSFIYEGCSKNHMVLGRYVVVLLLVVLCGVCVSAVSVMVPGGLSGEKLYLDVNDTVTLEFTLRGDGVVQNVQFFVKTGSSGVQVNGTNQFVQNVSLGIYEQRFFSVQVKGVASGASDIQYGFKYLGGQGGFGFEQVMQNSISVVVSGSQISPVTHPTVTTRFSSSGGGGSGSWPAQVKTSNVSNVTQGLSPIVVPSASKLNDASQSAGVNQAAQGKSVNAVQESASVVNQDGTVATNNAPMKVQGRTVLLVIIGLLAVILVVGGISMKMVRRADAA